MIQKSVLRNNYFEITLSQIFHFCNNFFFEVKCKKEKKKNKELKKFYPHFDFLNFSFFLLLHFLGIIIANYSKKHYSLKIDKSNNKYIIIIIFSNIL